LNHHHPLSDHPYNHRLAPCFPSGSCSDRGDGKCFFCGFTIKEPPPQEPEPSPCPDPLCLLDMTENPPCPQCPKNGHKPKRTPPYPSPSQPSWGGKRAGAGAPAGNLNAIKTGEHSKLIKYAVEKLAADKELRAFLLLIARAATTGEIPQTTQKLIYEALDTTQHLQATAALRRLRSE